MNKMTAYQQVKSKELLNLGWIEKSVKHHHTDRRERVSTYMYMYETPSGHRCYLAPDYIQHV